MMEGMLFGTTSSKSIYIDVIKYSIDNMADLFA